MHLLLLSETLSTTARQFNGVANSGKPFIYQGKRAVIDMASLALSDKVPALLLHDRSQRIGFGRLSIKDHALIIDGQLLDNDQACAIAKDAAAGFPWQMSAHVNAADSYELAAGESIEINGQTISYPCTILKQAVVREVSFTPTGVDPHTSAVILSSDSPAVPSASAPHASPTQNALAAPLPAPHSSPPTNKEPAMSQATATTDQALIDENQALKQTINQLKKQITELTSANKKATVCAKLSARGYESCAQGFIGLSAPTLELLLSADEDKLDEIINDLPRPASAGVSMLLSEQYSADKPAGEHNPLLSDAKARQPKP